MLRVIKTLLIAVMACVSSMAQAADYFSEVVQVAQRMGVVVEAVDVSKLGPKASDLEMGMMYFTISTGTPLSAHKSIKDPVCKVALNPNVSNEIWSHAGLREMAIAHEVSHCADFSRFSPRGRATTLRSEEMADLGAMFYIKKNKAPNEAKEVINMFYQMRQRDKHVDQHHPDGHLFVAHGDKEPESDYIAQANDLVEHSLLDRVIELF